MNTIQIKCFLTAVKYMNFSKAANELILTQPAISRHIGNLEEELGTLLFDRTGKNITLTEAGERYRDFFRRFYKELGDLRQVFSVPDSATVGTVRYSAFPVWNISETLLENARLMRRQHPNLSAVQNLLNTDFIFQLNDGTIDAVFHIYDVLIDHPGVESVKITQIPFIILFSDRHRLADKPGLVPADFKSEVFLYLADKTITKAIMNRLVFKAFMPYGFQPKVKSAPDFDSMMFMVESCEGVTLMDAWCRAKLNPKLRYLEMDNLENIGLGWLRGNKSPGLDTFVSETVRFFDERA